MSESGQERRSDGGPIISGLPPDNLGGQISDESVPGTRLFILGTSSDNRVMEDIACLPMIIFEAMIEANEDKRKAIESTVVE